MALWATAAITGVMLVAEAVGSARFARARPVCATGGRGGPPYSATDQPPARGTPPPRLGDLPPPPPGRASEDAQENERRFPVNEAQRRRENAQRARRPASGHVEVRGAAGAQACNGLTPEERIECPLRDGRDVLSTAEIPRGVRVRLRPAAVAPDKLQRLFDCHRSLVMSRPQSPGSCGFMDARTSVVVAGAPGRLELEITRPEDPGGLRQQVRAIVRDKGR
jgi:hypothetical protein